MEFDLVIIGSGPGGYVAAIRAAQLGLTTAIVEQRDTLGGTCLNIGCIPSKALLDSSESFSSLQGGLEEEGIQVGDVRLNLAGMMSRKDQIVRSFTSGVAGLLKRRKITVLEGMGRLISPNSVEIRGSGKTQKVLAKNIILASGSVPQELPFLPFNGSTIVSSTEALVFDSVPDKLLVVGAGAIGLELGSVWSRLGSKVTVIEILSAVLPGWDKQISDTLKRSLTKQGLSFEMQTKVEGFESRGEGILLKGTDKTGSPKEYDGDAVLVAVGRKPYTEGLGLEKLSIQMKEGYIPVDCNFQTNIPGIYAIGDLIPGPMLAHKASEEGIAVAEKLAGLTGHVNYETIPNVVYTSPEAASVGKTEGQLKDEGVPYRKGSFPFAANGRSLAMGEREGFAKLLAKEGTDEVLGAHIVGPWASDLIMEAVTVMEFGGSSEDIARTTHPHPTLSEVMKEAALTLDGRGIHRG